MTNTSSKGIFVALIALSFAVDNERMKQTDLNLDLTNRRTRKRIFLDEMERVVPWKEFVALITPHAPTKATGRKPFPIEAMLRITSCSSGST